MSLQVFVWSGSAWVDQSTFVLQVGTIDMLHSNPDCTLRDSNVSITTRYTGLPSIMITKGSEYKIVQNNICLYHGIVDKYSSNKFTRIYTINLRSALSKLKDIKIDETVLSTEIASISAVYDMGLNIDAYSMTSIIAWMLETKCNYDDHAFVNKGGNDDWYIPINSLWSIGSSVVSDDPAERIYAELSSLWDLLEAWCIYYDFKIFVSSASTDSKLNFMTYDESLQTTLPAVGVTWFFNEDDFKLEKNVRIIIKRIADLAEYDDLSSSPYTEDSIGGNQLIEVSYDNWTKGIYGEMVYPAEVIEYKLPTNCFFYYATVADPTVYIDGFSRDEFTLWYLNSNLIWKVKTNPTSIAGTRNCTEHQMVWQDGIMLSEIEIIKMLGM